MQVPGGAIRCAFVSCARDVKRSQLKKVGYMPPAQNLASGLPAMGEYDLGIVRPSDRLPEKRRGSALL
jgi:hypothetical protein